MIKNFKIRYDQEKFDYKTEFPREFSISFREFKEEFNVKFVKDKLLSNDIYIIDPKTGNPVKHDLKDDEVTKIFKKSLYIENFNCTVLQTKKYRNYFQVDGDGFATLIRNRENNENNPFRLVLVFTIYSNPVLPYLLVLCDMSLFP